MNFSFQSVLNVALLLISRIAALRGVCRYLCNIAPYDGYDMFTRIYVLGREQPFVNVVPRAGDSNHSVERIVYFNNVFYTSEAQAETQLEHRGFHSIRATFNGLPQTWDTHIMFPRNVVVQHSLTCYIIPAANLVVSD